MEDIFSAFAEDSEYVFYEDLLRRVREETTISYSDLQLTDIVRMERVIQDSYLFQMKLEDGLERCMLIACIICKDLLFTAYKEDKVRLVQCMKIPQFRVPQCLSEFDALWNYVRSCLIPAQQTSSLHHDSQDNTKTNVQRRNLILRTSTKFIKCFK